VLLVVIMVMILIIAVTMAPVPIALLLIRREMVVVAMRVEVILGDPLVVINGFLWSPGVIVAVIGIVGSGVVMGTTGGGEKQKASE
jgi:hypothetical protein